MPQGTGEWFNDKKGYGYTTCLSNMSSGTIQLRPSFATRLLFAIIGSASPSSFTHRWSVVSYRQCHQHLQRVALPDRRRRIFHHGSVLVDLREKDHQRRTEGLDIDCSSFGRVTG
jgi:hypothetical protein